MSQDMDYKTKFENLEVESNQLRKENANLLVKVWDLEKQLKEKDQFIAILQKEITK